MAEANFNNLPKLIDYVAKDNGWTKEDTGVFIRGFVESLKKLILAGEVVYLRGFATISRKYRQPQKARNPRENTEITLPGRYFPWCEFHRSFKKEVADIEVK